MDQGTTIALLAAGIIVAVAAMLGERARARAPLAWHAYMPWNAMIFVGLAGALFALVHLLTIVKAS